MPRTPRTTSAVPSAVPPPFQTADYRIAGIVLSIPGASLASVTPDPDKRKPLFNIEGLPDGFQARLLTEDFQVSARDVLRNQEMCLRYRQAHLGAR